jgi:hypothetical protein
VMRMPRIVGLPPHTSGSTLMRSNIICLAQLQKR